VPCQMFRASQASNLEQKSEAKKTPLGSGGLRVIVVVANTISIMSVMFALLLLLFFRFYSNCCFCCCCSSRFIAEYQSPKEPTPKETFLCALI
jgi:hypothetical protein